MQRRVRARGAPAREVERARIVLLAAAGVVGKRIAAIVGCAEPTVVTWRRRYAERGWPGWSRSRGQANLWLNLVEASFSIITHQVLRRGNFPTVADLIAAIQRFIDACNDRCTPLTWTKDPDTVIAKATDPRNPKAQTTSVTEH